MTAYDVAMRIALALLSAVVLLACSATPPPKPLPHWRAYIMTGPNGGEAYRVNCAQNIGYCYEGAGDSCPLGYAVIGSSDQSAFSTDSSGSAWGNRNVAFAEGSARTSKSFYATIVVACKTRPTMTAQGQ